MDNKSILVQTGSPDWVLHYWSWEKSKLMATVRTSMQPSAKIHDISFNPFDPTIFCVAGMNILKLFRYTEGQMKQISFKVEPKVPRLGIDLTITHHRPSVRTIYVTLGSVKSV